MPVVPKGISPFTIRPPLTSADMGAPSASILKDAQRVLDFIEDERHLTALKLYESVKSRMDTWDGTRKKRASTRNPNKGGWRGAKSAAGDSTPQDIDFSDAKAFLQGKQRKIVKLQNRCRIFKRALYNLNVASDWTLASSLFGVKTFYRREEDGSLTLKLEGELNDCPLFEQVCVLKEVDLHYKWAPFCSSSMTIADLDKLDVVGWFVIGLASFGLARDGVFRAIGCDNMFEDGSILLAGQGIRDLPEGAPLPKDTYLSDDPILDKLDIPPIPTRRGAGRMTMRTFDAVIHITSPTTARTRLVANVDPNMPFLPQPLLEFVMKNLAGVLLAKLQSAAKKIPRNPLHNEHARRMRDEEDFYRHWLMAKFQAVSEANGWTMPSVSAFELTEEQLRKDHQIAEKRAKKDLHRRAVSFQEPADDGVDVKVELRRLHSAPEHLESPEADAEGSLQQARTVAIRKESDDAASEVSALSSKSSRSLGFGLGKALKVREARKRQEKEDKVAQTRQMAAQRLLPKEFSLEKQERLEELREMKAQRSTHPPSEVEPSPERTGHDPRIESEPPIASKAVPTGASLQHASSAPFSAKVSSRQRRPSTSEKVTDSLYRHGPVTRLFILLLLTAVLFVLLHPKLLLSLLAPDMLVVWQDMSSWRGTTLRTVGVIMYLTTCTMAHFALCDIALVYAFDSLELGSKAGRQLRKFYSAKVRLGVALASFGMFGVALASVVGKVFLRHLSWLLLHGYLYSVSVLEQASETFGPHIPGIVTYAWTATTPTAAAAWISIRATVQVVVTFFDVLIQSNGVTTKLAGLVARGLSTLPFLWKATLSFANDSIAIVDGEVEARPWYEEAFVTSKFLFAYTSVFLVTALILFNVSAKQAAAKSIKNVIDDGDMSTNGSDLDSRTNSSYSPRDQNKDAAKPETIAVTKESLSSGVRRRTK